jgi:hypothetical protein
MAAVQSKRHFTQWAAQFAVASELCKRGYEVSFTLGHNTPLADLMIISPKKHKMFLIDVKGLAGKNYWQITHKEKRDDLFYILTYVSARRRIERVLHHDARRRERRYICRVRSIEARETSAR